MTDRRLPKRAWPRTAGLGLVDKKDFSLSMQISDFGREMKTGFVQSGQEKDSLAGKDRPSVTKSTKWHFFDIPSSWQFIGPSELMREQPSHGPRPGEAQVGLRHGGKKPTSGLKGRQQIFSLFLSFFLSLTTACGHSHFQNDV